LRIINFDRFFVENDKFDIYNDIEDKNGDILKHHPEVFLLACSIGYQYSIKKEITSKKGLVRKQSILNVEFNKINYGELIYEAFKYISIQENDIDDEGNLLVNKTMEEYANGGITKLKNEILNKNAKKEEIIGNYIMLNLD